MKRNNVKQTTLRLVAEAYAHITISAKTAEEVKTAHHFNRDQITALRELPARPALRLEQIGKGNKTTPITQIGRPPPSKNAVAG